MDIFDKVNDFLKRDFGYQGRKFNKITNDPQNIKKWLKPFTMWF